MLCAALVLMRPPQPKSALPVVKGPTESDLPPHQVSQIAEIVRRTIAEDDGIRISLKTPGHERAGDENFCGMCGGAAGGGAAVCTPTKCDELHSEENAFMDMDAAIGYKRKPGTAGAHPIMQRARDVDDYKFMYKQAGSLVPAFPPPSTD